MLSWSLKETDLISRQATILRDEWREFFDLLMKPMRGKTPPWKNVPSYNLHGLEYWPILTSVL